MGNLITNRKASDQTSLQLSNGAMSVLLSTLALSGSDMAVTPWEIECVTWLAQRDQSIFGLGLVGFDIDDLAWRRDDFDAQHAFVLTMIDRAASRRRWDVLDYDPPFAEAQLRALHQMVSQYQLSFVEPDTAWDWWAQPEQYTKCPHHQVYLHAYGCVICNDQ
jgi:hypothetical protein